MHHQCLLTTCTADAPLSTSTHSTPAQESLIYVQGSPLTKGLYKLHVVPGPDILVGFKPPTSWSGVGLTTCSRSIAVMVCDQSIIRHYSLIIGIIAKYHIYCIVQRNKQAIVVISLVPLRSEPFELSVTQVKLESVTQPPTVDCSLCCYSHTGMCIPTPGT